MNIFSSECLDAAKSVFKYSEDQYTAVFDTLDDKGNSTLIEIRYVRSRSGFLVVLTAYMGDVEIGRITLNNKPSYDAALNVWNKLYDFNRLDVEFVEAETKKATYNRINKIHKKLKEN